MTKEKKLKRRIILYSIFLVALILFASSIYYFNYREYTATITIDGDETYTGQFKGGSFHGYGKFTNCANVTYEGQWNQGNIEGKGKMTFADGSTYEGEFIDGYYHGQGSITYPDGKKVTGTWQNGKLLK